MVTLTQNSYAIPGFHCGFGAVTDIKRPYKWHWMRDGVLLAGAPSACSYTTPPLQQSDFGHKYSVKVFGMDGEVEISNEVTLGATPESSPEPEPELEPEKEV